MTGSCIEDVNHEIYGGIYSQMIFGESFQEPVASPVMTQSESPQVAGCGGRSGGTAVGRYAIVKEHPFAGTQSQQITFESGRELGIENQGPQPLGNELLAGKGYEGYAWIRAEKPVAAPLR